MVGEQGQVPQPVTLSKSATGRGEALDLAFWVLLPLAVGVTSGLSSQGSIASWYQTLTKPAFNPPDAIFGPVWTTLYIMMGIAAYLALREGRRKPELRDRAVVARNWFLLQLLLNGAWSVIFFGLQAPFWGLVEILALLLAIVATMRAFAPLSRAAVWLMTPYLAWVSFATVLNASLWWMNR